VPRQSMIPQKKRGARPAGESEPIMVRLRPVPLAALDAWIARQGDAPSRPEAIRRLVDIGLGAERPTKQRSPKAVSKAHQLASEQIDKLIKSSLTNEERQHRKRHLLKGPRELRDIRRDTKSKR
jgi:hypothetical protein